MSYNSDNFTVGKDARTLDYDKLIVHKNAGRNCGGCAHGVTKDDAYRCSFKKNKVVNKLAICHHFKE